MKYFNYFLSILFPIALLTGCAPIYRTNYSYTPPQSTTGLMCINSCESALRNCHQVEDLKKSNCKIQSELEYQRCMNAHKDDANKHWWCSEKSCDTNHEQCTDEYNRCYQNCGGSITTSQTCTAFCN